MNRSTKIVLGVIATLALACLCVGGGAILVIRSAGQVLAQTLTTDRAQMASIKSAIAEYQLPAGYHEDYAMSMLGYSLVAYANGDGHSHIMLMRAPATFKADRAEIERQLQQATQFRGNDRPQRFTTVGQKQAIIRGQNVTLVIGEGTNSEGQMYRQVMAAFESKGGTALVVVEEPLSRWNQAEVDAFLASIQ